MTQGSRDNGKYWRYIFADFFYWEKAVADSGKMDKYNCFVKEIYCEMWNPRYCAVPWVLVFLVIEINVS